MDLRRALLRQRYFKAHPRDTLTPEIWKVLARLYPSFLKMMDNTTLEVINALVSLSLSSPFSLSPIWPVPRHSGKQGLKGKSPVNGLHCFSRALMRLSFKRLVLSPCVYYGVAGRRREEAVGAALNIQARCIRAGRSYMFKLRDVLGAFTGVDAQIRNAAKEETQNAPEAAHYNQHAHTILRAPGGGDWRITKGTR